MAVQDLFRNRDLATALRAHQQSMVDEINSLAAEYVLNTSTDRVLEYYIEKYMLKVPHLNESGITSEYSDSWKSFTDEYEGRAYRQPGTQFVFFVPYQGDEWLFKYRPSTSTLSYVKAEIKPTELVFGYFRDFSGFNGHDDREAEAVVANFQNDLKQVKDSLIQVEKDVEVFLSSMKTAAKNQLQLRKNKFLQDRGIGESLGFPLRKRSDIPETFLVPVVKKTIPSKPHSNNRPYIPEPAIDQEVYEHILKVIADMIKVIERSPKAFQKLKEEHLRDHILVQLNGHYEGQATGETFNFEGKTDILIRAEGRNVFIAECKFWKGAKVLTETLDQLLGYTSWRDTKTAIILFNRNKNLSTVLEQIPSTVSSHPNYRRSLSKQLDTQFRYVFTHRDDPNRELQLTIIVFEVPQ